MKYILTGTNRPGSRTLELARHIQGIYENLGDETEIIDLGQLEINQLNGHQYGRELPPNVSQAIHKINCADGLIVVCPEYNGSMPGALKYFIDHWKYPDSFESRPICLIGLGARFGGLRPVEHLQQVFNYRNAYVFPNRVFVMNVAQVLVDGKIADKEIEHMLVVQAKGFIKFVRALENESMDANSILRVKTQS